MTTLPHYGQHRLPVLVGSSRSIATLINRPVTRSPIRLMTRAAEPGATASEGIPRRRSPTSSTHTSDLGAGSRSATHLQAQPPGSRFPTSLTADQPGEPTHRLPRRSRSEFTPEYHPPSTYSRPTPLAGESLLRVGGADRTREHAAPDARHSSRGSTGSSRRQHAECWRWLIRHHSRRSEGWSSHPSKISAPIPARLHVATGIHRSDVIRTA